MTITKQAGTKIYYCLLTGNILEVIYDKEGMIEEYTFEQDCQRLKSLKDINIETIGLLEFKYGQYFSICEGILIGVNVETKEPIFEQYTEEIKEPDKIEVLENKVSILNEQNSKLLLDKAKNEIQINILNKNLANVTLEVVKMKGGM